MSSGPLPELVCLEAVLQTVPLTVLDSVRERGPSAFGDEAPIYGWHEQAYGLIDGAFLQTPPSGWSYRSRRRLARRVAGPGDRELLIGWHEAFG